MKNKNPLLFVYGTLKAGHGNHSVLGPNAKLVCKGTTYGFEMRSNGGFPYCFPSNHRHVIGEVYEGIDMSSCDALEGYPYHYDRMEVTVMPHDNSMPPIIAWMYFVTDYMRERNNYRLIEEGIWT